jgi:hypothetical protein
MRTAGLAMVFGFALMLITAVYLGQTLVIVQRIAMVDRVQGGPVVYVHGKGRPVRLQEGRLVRARDVIETTAGESVELRWMRWVGGMRVKVGPESRLLIKKAIVNTSSKAEESRLRLDRGNVWIRLRERLRGKSKFEVETPTVVAAVRGTIFHVAVAEDGTSQVDVYEGTVALTGQAGAAATLTSGSEAVVKRGQRGATSQPLSPACERAWQAQDTLIGPFLEVTAPQDGAAVTQETTTVRGRAERGAVVLVNGAAATVDEKGQFQEVVPLKAGVNAVTVIARDGSGHEVKRALTLVRGDAARQ